MPHACTKCTKVYADKSDAILRGCTCGSRVFHFIKSTLPQQQQFQPVQLTALSESAAGANGNGNGSALDSVVDEMAIQAGQGNAIAIESTLEPDAVENIKVIEPGSYSINVPSLMKGGPVVLKSDAGVYYVRLPEPNGKKR